MPSLSHPSLFSGKAVSPFQALLARLTGVHSPTRSSVLRRGTKALTTKFTLVEHGRCDRAIAEQFISQCFSESFGSRVDAFMPRLFTLRDVTGEICGAFGLRSAHGPLFLEQYLDQPIECSLQQRFADSIPRQNIIEVGHFSGSFPGAVRAMIALLTERLHHEGYAWVVFTGTTALRNAFCRLGLAPLVLQAADVGRLPLDERAAWGSYYDHQPQVLAGNIREGFIALCDARGHQMQLKVAA